MNILPTDISKLIKSMVLDLCYGELLDCQQSFVVLEGIADECSIGDLPDEVGMVWQNLALDFPKLFDEFTHSEFGRAVVIEGMYHRWSTGIKEVDLQLAAKLLSLRIC